MNQIADESLLTIKTAQKYLKSKKHFYEAMVRNRWYLPNLKSSIVTQEYMTLIREKTIWCPKYDELNQQPCPQPPSKAYLLKEVKKLALQKGLNLGISEQLQPDLKWLLQVLAIFKSDHAIFKKEYQPPINQRNLEEEKVVSNSDRFFDNLPQLSKKRDLKRISRLGLYHSSSQEAQVKQWKEKMAKLNQRLAMTDEAMKSKDRRRDQVKIAKATLDEMKSRIKDYEKEVQQLRKKKTPAKTS